MSGPSATAKPMSAKISTTSSNTWLTGWMRPSCSGPRRTGSVTSAFSLARRAESAPRSSSALRPSSASLTRALRPLTACPKALRWSPRQRAERRHQLGHAPLLAERGDAHALDAPRGRRQPRSRRASALSRAARSVVSCHPLSSRGLSPGSMYQRAAARHWYARDSCSDGARGALDPGHKARDELATPPSYLGGGLVAERLEAGRVLDGEVGQHLAVDVDAGLARGR